MKNPLIIKVNGFALQELLQDVFDTVHAATWNDALYYAIQHASANKFEASLTEDGIVM